MNNEQPTLPPQPSVQPPVQPATQSITSNATFQTLIPTQNKQALIGYYFGVFGLIPFLGFPFAVTAIILGAKGLKKAKLTPTPGAKGHAMTALVLGIFAVVCLLGFVAFATFMATSSK